MFDPNAPAFGPEAQKAEDLKTATTPEPVVPVVKEQEQIPSDEENKVPYSRFKKFHDAAREAEATAERYRLEAEEWKHKASSYEPKTETADLPDFWKELYGDSEASKKAWVVQSKANQSLIEQARQEAREAVKAEAREESERVENNSEAIESGLETLSEYAGRKLSEAEQSAVLDIIDDYSPKDEDGNFISPIPFEKAYDIYELQQQASKAPKVASRNRVASITNAQTQGQASDDQVERNKNFNPMDWGAALRRVQGK